MGERIEFASNGGTATGYLATPASGSGIPLVVIQEWWGLVPHIEDVCDRFAAEGFVALAPDLYRGESTTEPDEAGKLMMAMNLDQAAKDMGGAVDEVAAARGRRPGRRHRVLHGRRAGPRAGHPAPRQGEGVRALVRHHPVAGACSPTGRPSTRRCSATSPSTTGSSRRRPSPSWPTSSTGWARRRS